MNENTNARIWLIAGLILGAALLRLLPHPPNFTPLGAIALFAGARFARRSLALVIPLAAMLLSDGLLELTTGWGFHGGMPVVYATLALIVTFGFLVRRAGIRPLSVGLGACGAATVFFIITNFFVWLGSGMYPLTLAGLVSCYVAAIPFFGNTLAGDLFYSAALFGSFVFAERTFPRFAPAATSNVTG